MRNSQLRCIALGIVAMTALTTNFASGQGPAGVAKQIAGSAGNAAANTQVQQQVQTQVQSQIQAQVQQQTGAQIQRQLPPHAQLKVDTARAGLMAQHAIDTARQQAIENRFLNTTGSLEAKIDGKVQAQSQALRQQNGLSIRSDASINSSLNRPNTNMPAGFVEADIAVYDAVFGKHNPFREIAAQNVEAEMKAEATVRGNHATPPGLQSNQGIITASAKSGIDLAVKIDAAVQQRRSEISLMRDRALDASDEALMERAEHLEKVLDLFIEARARAAAESRGQMDAEGNVVPGWPRRQRPDGTRINTKQDARIQSSSEAAFGNGKR